MSIVQANRKQLEALGDYVTRANIDWSAVFPDKLAEFEERAAANSRDCHLIVYRTRTENPRDHHVIPVSLLSELLTEDSLTHSNSNDTIRWNVTLVDHILRVTHNTKSVDVSQFYELPLAIESGSSTGEFTHAIDFEPPSTARVASTVYRILRDTEIAKQLKIKYNYCCQICASTIELPDGSRYAEAHHIKPLGRPHNGPDCAENLLVLCPNHHAMCDYGAIQLAVEVLHFVDGHKMDARFIDYHNNHIYSGVQLT